MTNKQEASELAAWFQTRYGDRIRSDLKEYLESYYAARSKLAERDDEVGEGYLSATPPRLTTRYEVAAPDTARKGRPVEMELRLFSGVTPWVIGHYVAHLDARGRIGEEDLDWCPMETEGVPWPIKADRLPPRPRAATSLAGFREGAGGFLDFLGGFAEDYWEDRETLFDGYDAGLPLAGNTVRTRPSGSGMSTGGELVKRQALAGMKKKHAARSRSDSDVDLTDVKDVMQHLLRSPKVDKARKEHAAWIDRLRLSSPEDVGRLYRDLVIPLYVEKAKEGDVDLSELWTIVNRRALAKGFARLECGCGAAPPSKMGLDRNGSCSIRGCTSRTTSAATGQCRNQNMEYMKRTNKTTETKWRS